MVLDAHTGRDARTDHRACHDHTMVVVDFHPVVVVHTLNVDAPIVQGDGWEQLKKGVGQYIGSSAPGRDGNLVLSAHNDVYGELFRYLDRLVPGDQVIVYTQQRQFTYIVDRTVLVEPTAVEVMSPTASPTVTLISCYPYLINDQRIVVFARLQD